MLKIQLCHHRNTLFENELKYKTIILNSNIVLFLLYLTALVSIKGFFEKRLMFKIFTGTYTCK